MKARSGARAATPNPPGSSGEEQGSREPGSGARAPGARDGGRAAPPRREVRSSEPAVK